MRQYKKNIGRTVEVASIEGEPVTGVLKDVQEDRIILALKGTKKAPPKDVEIPFSDIKTIIVQITF
jgi:ribosome maturation factor RimP